MTEMIFCPFCGSSKTKITKKRSGNYRRRGDYIQVLCNKCKARGPIFEAKHEEVTDDRGHVLYTRSNSAAVAHAEQLAIEAWNRRVQDEK